MNYRMSTRRTLAFALYVTAAAMTPQGADAFLQTTKNEGVIGKDISGVYLAVHNVTPLFRLRIERTSPEHPVPFEVGPVGAELAPLFGGPPQGVVIKMIDPSVSSRMGVFEGDIITKVGSKVITDVASFERALVDWQEKPWFQATIRRTALRYTSTRLVKIEYEAAEGQVADGTTGLASEAVQFTISDATLPFEQDAIKARDKHELFTPDPKAVAKLATDWWTLPWPEKSIWVSAEHRVVAEHDYDASLRQDDNLHNTLFAVMSTVQGNPMSGGGGKTIWIYGVRTIDQGRLAGTYVETTFASAPFPISIEFSGAFTMTRLGDYSDKDIKYRTERMKKAQKTFETENVKLAPDMPAVVPKEDSPPPKVAE